MARAVVPGLYVLYDAVAEISQSPFADLPLVLGCNFGITPPEEEALF